MPQESSAASLPTSYLSSRTPAETESPAANLISFPSILHFITSRKHLFLLAAEVEFAFIACLGRVSGTLLYKFSAFQLHSWPGAG